MLNVALPPEAFSFFKFSTEILHVHLELNWTTTFLLLCRIDLSPQIWPFSSLPQLSDYRHLPFQLLKPEIQMLLIHILPPSLAKFNPTPRPADCTSGSRIVLVQLYPADTIVSSHLSTSPSPPALSKLPARQILNSLHLHSGLCPICAQYG